MSTPMFLACQNEVRQERIKGRKSMVFAVEFSDSDHICKQNQWRSLRFGSVKKGLVLSGSKGGVPWQFEAGKLWQIVLFFRQTPAIFKFDAAMFMKYVISMP